MEEKIKEFRKIYSKIPHVTCAAFGGEKVYFNRHGITHLISKGRIPRRDEDVLRRFFLFKFTYQILEKEKEVFEYRQDIRKGVTAHFWTIKTSLKKRVVKVLIRQFNNGTKHFFSIMDKT